MVRPLGRAAEPKRQHKIFITIHMKEKDSNLPELLKLLRLINNLSLVELSKKINLSKTYISNLESGQRNISDEILSKYSKCFKIPIKTLRFFEATANKNKFKTQEMLILLLSKTYNGNKIKYEVTLNQDNINSD